MAVEIPSGVSPLLSILTTPPSLLGLLLVLVILLPRLLTPRLDPREPPLLPPRVPLIGHILNLLWHQAHFHTLLQRSSRLPIATLPMLTGKLYAVWDPHLVSAGLRAKSLSSQPHIVAATPIVADVSAEGREFLKSDAGPPLFHHMMHHAIPTSLKGANLAKFTAAALPRIAEQFSALALGGETVAVPNTFHFVRQLLTKATTPALYGAANDPFKTTPEMEPALWSFAANLLPLTFPLPSFLQPSAGRKARLALSEGLKGYYAARQDADPDVSEFVRKRARVLREAGMPEGDLARVEVMLPFAALVNTAPAVFWGVWFVLSSAGVVGRVRGEVEGLVVKREGDQVVMKIPAVAEMEERCPLLVGCYRETLRRTVHQVSTRTALEDTVLTDKGGREYLLKKGAVVQMVVGVAHAMEEYWGEGVDEFRPERFLAKAESGDDGPGSARAVRAAFQPFGGGVHLCPGRHFAFSEMMAIMATLVLGFDAQPLGGGEWKRPRFATRSVIDAVTKPADDGEGFGIKITRRAGWENVRWAYEV